MEDPRYYIAGCLPVRRVKKRWLKEKMKLVQQPPPMSCGDSSLLLLFYPPSLS
jgi:hypothetical protein